MLLCNFPSGLLAQGLCDQPEGTEKGDFDLEEFTLCAPKSVIVKDKSGGQNIRYNFVYQGQGPEGLNPNIPFQDRYRYTGFVNPTVFTIIQYGTKNGKPMYACKSHIVRQSNKAKYSFTACDRTSFSIAIPKDSVINDYDYYEISTNKFNTIIETVNANELPFEKKLNIPIPVRIYVRGVYNDPSKNCSGDISSDFIANPAIIPTTGLDLPFHANIDAVLLKEKGIELDLRGGLVGSSYSLFKRDINGTFPTEPIAKGLTPGRKMVEFENSLSQSCFLLRKEQTGCRTEESAEICTTPITEIKQLQGKQRVFFQQYPEPYKGEAENTQNYLKIGQQSILIIENNSSSSSKGIEPKQDSIDIEVFGCEKELCYYTTTFVEGQNKGILFRTEVRSNVKCFVPGEKKIDQNFSIATTLNDKNLVQINIDEITPGLYPLSNYFIFQKEENTFKAIDTLKAPSSKYETQLDGSEQSYCFKLQARDECGSYTPLSDPICTIFLEFNDNKTLVWTKEKPFAGEVETYEILTRGASGNLDKSFYELEGNVFEYEPNLALFEDEAAFRVRALSPEGSSVSNIVTKELKPKIFLPTAFTPNSDGNNDVLKLIGNTTRVKEISFKILNRLGQAVFETSDPNFEWSPKGSEALIGSYYFDLKVILDNGESIMKNGNFSILK